MNSVCHFDAPEDRLRQEEREREERGREKEREREVCVRTVMTFLTSYLYLWFSGQLENR